MEIFGSSQTHPPPSSSSSELGWKIYFTWWGGRKHSFSTTLKVYCEEDTCWCLVCVCVLMVKYFPQPLPQGKTTNTHTTTCKKNTPNKHTACRCARIFLWRTGENHRDRCCCCCSADDDAFLDGECIPARWLQPQHRTAHQNSSTSVSHNREHKCKRGYRKELNRMNLQPVKTRVSTGA